MNYIYGEPKLNIKKVIIALIVLLFLLVLGIIIIFSNKKKNISNVEKKDKTFLIDNSFNITFHNDLNLEQTESSNGFLLELHSDNGFSFYISKIEGFENEDFYKIAKSDYFYYLQNFESKLDVSDLSEYSIKEYPGYTYNFKYIDSNITYYLCVYILKINNNIYTFNVQIPVEKLDNILHNIDLIMNTIQASVLN